MGVLPDLPGENLIEGGSHANLVGIEANGFARQHVHAPQVRAGGCQGLLMIETANEYQVFANRREGLRGGTEFHPRALSFSPPVSRFHAVREEDGREAQRWLVRRR